MKMLNQFNQQVLQCQDDAFTLAWYLLGDESIAEKMTQAAVQAAFRYEAANREDCRLAILQQVVTCCHGYRPKENAFAKQAGLKYLSLLPEAERVILVLVDVIGLSYNAAARITVLQRNEVGQRLARARQRISRLKDSGHAM